MYFSKIVALTLEFISPAVLVPPPPNKIMLYNTYTVLAGEVTYQAPGVLFLLVYLPCKPLTLQCLLGELDLLQSTTHSFYCELGNVSGDLKTMLVVHLLLHAFKFGTNI